MSKPALLRLARREFDAIGYIRSETVMKLLAVNINPIYLERQWCEEP